MIHFIRMNMFWPVIYIPLVNWDEVTIYVTRRAGRWIECGEIFCVVGEAVGHLVVYFQDAALGAVLAKFFFVFAFNDGECIQYVIYCMSRSGEVLNQRGGKVAR